MNPEAGPQSLERKTRPHPPPRYHLEHGGQQLEVETEDVGLGHTARLFIDGHLRDERAAKVQRAALRAGQITVEVVWGDFGGLESCVLALREEAASPPSLSFTPPPGSRAARLETFKQVYPLLYAARHLIKPLSQILFTVLGLGVLLTAFLPRFDWTWLPPFVQEKLFGTGPAWLESIINSPVFQIGKWAVLVIIALSVARDEYKKRKEAQKGASRGTNR